jgi:hypothetical protein
MILFIGFGFVLKGFVLAAEGGTCSCESVLNNSGLVDHFNVINGCNDGYEPYYGDVGYGCGCECQLNGTTEPLGQGYTNISPGSICPTDTINTALGCVSYTTDGFASWLLKMLFGIAGGIAFLLMIYGFILLGTSSGDEKKIQGAKETISSAIIGLLVCIFALFIFRLIAVNILQIPGIN